MAEILTEYQENSKSSPRPRTLLPPSSLSQFLVFCTKSCGCPLLLRQNESRSSGAEHSDVEGQEAHQEPRRRQRVCSSVDRTHFFAHRNM